MPTSKSKLIKITFKSSELNYKVTVEPAVAAQIIAMLAQQNLILHEKDFNAVEK